MRRTIAVSLVSAVSVSMIGLGTVGTVANAQLFVPAIAAQGAASAGTAAVTSGKSESGGAMVGFRLRRLGTAS